MGLPDRGTGNRKPATIMILLRNTLLDCTDLRKRLFHMSLRGMIITCAIGLGSSALGGIGSGTSGPTTIDTEPPAVFVDQFPENTLYQGGDLVPFHWTTADTHPGTGPEHFTASVMIEGQANSTFSFFPEVDDYSWEWVALEVSSANVHLRIEARDAFGNLTVGTSNDFTVLKSVTGVPVPARNLSLSAPAPNPFNPATSLRFHLPAAGPVTLDVYDTRGRRVRSLLSGTRQAGDFDVTWDGRDDRGLAQAGGLYLFVLEFRGSGRTDRITRKAVLIP
jgi:hypothetical protein